MKNLVTITIIALSCYSAATAQPIVGIGDIKIGMSQKEFLALSDIKSRTVQDASNKTWDSNDRYVWRKTSESVVPESHSKMPQYWKVYTPEYVKYELKLAIGIKNLLGQDSYDTNLEFYKNELISISLNVSSSFSEFQDILNEKYGKPSKKIDNMKKEICQNGYGAKSEHNTGFFAWEWEGKGPIQASLILSNSNYSKNIIPIYSISHSKKKLLVLDLETQAQDAATNEDTKSKASSSKL